MWMSKIAVVGDVMLDHAVYYTTTWRINPENPLVPLLNNKSKTEEWKLGWAGNLAANVAWMIGNVLLIGAYNEEDPHSSMITQLCTDHHVTFTWLPTHTQAIIKEREYIDKRYHTRKDDEDENWIHIDELDKHHIDMLLNQHGLSHIVISDYAKWTIDQQLVDILKSYSRKRNIHLLADTKPKNLSMYHDIFLLKPNFSEFCEMIGKTIPNTNDAIEAAWKDFVAAYGSNLVVTRWDKGATVITKDGTTEHLFTEANEVGDVTGAGDTFLAWLVVWLTEKMSLTDAVRYGNKASGIAVTRRWTTVVTKDDMS